MISKFDERNNLIVIECYGIDGRRCLTKDGFAKMTADYDERGNKIEVATFDEGGKPAQRKDCLSFNIEHAGKTDRHDSESGHDRCRRYQNRRSIDLKPTA